MALDPELREKIKNFVYQQPRSIDEIAKFIGKSWKTTDRYVKRIAETEGTIRIRVFREGSRGSLSVIYWSNLEKIYSTDLQEKIFERIRKGIYREDFQFLDIFQYVDQKKRLGTGVKKDDNKWLLEMLLKAEEELLIFSGNMSWINQPEVVAAFEKLSAKNVIVRIISRVDLTGYKNIENAMAINDRMKKNYIEVRDARQPLRGFIIDAKLARFKDTIMARRKKNELENDLIVHYDIEDENWIQWLKNIFWKEFQQAIPARKKLEDIYTVKISKS